MTTDRVAFRQLFVGAGDGSWNVGRLAKPAAMTALAFGLGAALLGVAGWFIGSSAVAGLAVASTFSFLFPSAAVQALAWARTLGRYGERISTHKTTLDLVGSLRTSLFARAMLLPRDRVAELRTSELVGRITVDTDAVENLLLRGSFPIIAAVAGLVGAVAAFAPLSPVLATVAAIGLLVTAGVLVGLAQPRAGRPARALVAARAGARRAVIETLDGLPELRSFGAEQRAAAEVARRLESFGASRRRLTTLAARGQSVGSLLADATLVAIVATGGGLIGAHGLSAPFFVAACLVALVVFEPVLVLPAAGTARARARAAAARLTEVFPNSAPAAGAHAAPGGPWTAEIELDGDDMVLVLAPGDTVLLTGVSGSGKSTILRALGGHPAPGLHVRIAGADVATIDPDVLVEHVALVAQDAHVFDGTIRDNLLLAEPTADEPELCGALAAAALDDTVAAFRAGLDTRVGPGGTFLSGGQRRRLSVAQGLLRRADVLLLDEPTEGLDAANAARLLAGVREFDPGAALVIALHDRQSLALPWTPTARIELPLAAASLSTRAIEL